MAKTQELLFSIANLLDLNPLQQYELFFSNVDLSPIKDEISPYAGRKPFSRKAIMRAFMYKNIRGIYYLTDLVDELNHNPSIAHRCGFDIRRALPSVDRYSRFLSDTPNSMLQQIRETAVQTLISLKVIKGGDLTIDSTPIFANVKENNPKILKKNKFNKNNIPPGDKDARLGVMVAQPRPLPPTEKNKIQFFWGYRNHALSEMPLEIPVYEKTKPANVQDPLMFIPMFKYAKYDLGLPCHFAIGDALYDAEYIRKFVVYELKATPIIPINPRAAKAELKLSPSNRPICIAGFEMLPWGKFIDRGRLRQKFVCPILKSKKFAKQHPICPWRHPLFLKGTGCTAYLRPNKDPNLYPNSNSALFQEKYRLRNGAEHVFSRLLNYCMQYPTVVGLDSVSNHCTIAHITVLAVAITAVKTNNPDKIRSVKKLLRNISNFRDF